MQALSVVTTENWSVCLGYYRRRGDAPHKERYAYVPNGGTLGACLETISYGYDAAHQDWADQLTSYYGEAIRYDDSGNPISYRGYTMAWQGKRLTSATKTGTAITYSYDENGIRTQKTVNGVSTNYYYNGSVLISQVTGNDTLLFSYDASGSVVSVNFNGTDYYYVRNGQGDVVKLIDGNGATVTEYTYDTWGKQLSCTGSLASTLGAQNPFRYRGYVYDTETGWYYLQSRYYDPEVCRFISADVFLSTGQGVLGHNTFAYCLNNPVNRSDPSGYSSEDEEDEDGDGIPDYLEQRWKSLPIHVVMQSAKLHGATDSALSHILSALQHLGTEYPPEEDGEHPRKEGYLDCSQLVEAVYGSLLVGAKRQTSRYQWKYVAGLEPQGDNGWTHYKGSDISAMKPGDVVFYAARKNGYLQIFHVSIYLGGELMIDSTDKVGINGVSIRSIHTQLTSGSEPAIIYGYARPNE